MNKQNNVTLHDVSFTGEHGTVYKFHTVHTTEADAAIFKQSKEMPKSTHNTTPSDVPFKSSTAKYNININYGPIGNGATVNNMIVNTSNNGANMHNMTFGSANMHNMTFDSS